MSRTGTLRSAAEQIPNGVHDGMQVARVRLGAAGRRVQPKVKQVKPKVKSQVEPRLAKVRPALEQVGPRVVLIREAVAPKVAVAVEGAKTAARGARQEVVPKVTAGVASAVAGTKAATEPLRTEAALRGQTALAALRGELTAEDVAALRRKLHRRERRAQRIRRTRRALAVGAGLSAATAAVVWWRRTTTPSWLTDDTGDATSVPASGAVPPGEGESATPPRSTPDSAPGLGLVDGDDPTTRS